MRASPVVGLAGADWVWVPRGIAGINRKLGLLWIAWATNTPLQKQHYESRSARG